MSQRRRGRVSGLVMTVTEPAQRPKDPDSATSDSDHPEDETSGLKRHIGRTGLLFAGVGSIIGSGWLFGALERLERRRARRDHLVGHRRGHDPADRPRLRRARHDVPAVRRRGALPALRLRLVRELHAGWITWVAVASDRARSRSRRRSSTPPSTPASPAHARRSAAATRCYTLTALGYVAAAVLHGVLRRRQLLSAIRWFARVNNALVGWKLAIIVLVIVAFFVTAFHGSNFTQLSGFAPYGCARGVHRDRDRRHRLLLPRLPPGHRARRRDRQPEAQRAHRRDRLGADHRPSSTSLCRSPSSAPSRPARPRPRLGSARRSPTTSARSPAIATHHRARLAGDAALRRRGHLPGRHRPDLHHGHLPDLLRDGAQRQRARRRWPADHRPRRAVGQPRRSRSSSA